jgi:hypothetical protein
MPDEDEDVELITSSEQIQKPGLRKYVQGLEKRAKEAEGTANVARELAFWKAGVNNERHVRLLMNAHDGEITPEAVKATLAEFGVAESTQEPEKTAEQLEAERERQVAIEGQRHMAEQRFGDLRPEVQSSEQRLIADMTEAIAKVRATGAMDSRSQIEAVRGVLHQHNMVMTDEVD